MHQGGPAPRVIDGRFELLTRLGGGGMGTVWRARDLLLDRDVALKEVRPPDPDLAEYDPQAAALLRRRVLREARALARVDHPDVVTIHHVVDGGEGTFPWLVMELVTGGSLADRLARGPMAPTHAARLGRHLLAALRAAHESGIQHRDIKPANVLLRPDGRPALTDFGIAAIRESTALTATGSVIGTPDYMAPERVSGTEGGPESDLWSLAMMLYVAVEGHHPLRRATPLATLAAVLSETLPPPRRAGALTPILVAILVKDPARRPSTVSVDAMLAEAESADASITGTGAAHRPDPATAEGPRVVPDDSAGAPTETSTSYRIASPAHDADPTHDADPPSDAVPPHHAAPTHDALPGSTGASAEEGIEAPAPTPTRPRAAIGTVVALVLAATTALSVTVWALVPDGGSARTGSPAPSASSPATAKSPTPTPTRTQEPAKDVDLLTPDGIRTALKALEKATGTSRMSSLTVYPEHVSASVMVDGSRTRYDNWTYRTEGGAEKGIISGSVTPLESPFDTRDLNWDPLPTLLKKAHAVLGVEDPTSRYLVVRAPDPTFHTALGMAVYLSNKYSESGYLETDARGKVRRTMPNEG